MSARKTIRMLVVVLALVACERRPKEEIVIQTLTLRQADTVFAMAVRQEFVGNPVVEVSKIDNSTTATKSKD